MRYLFIIMSAMFLALQSSCQLASARRDRIIADSVRNYISRSNPHGAPLDTVTIIKTNVISQKELLQAYLATTNDRIDDVFDNLKQDSAKIKSYEADIALFKGLLQEHRQNKGQQDIEREEKVIKIDEDEIARITQDQVFIRRLSRYSALLQTRDSIINVLPAADATKKDNYLSLVYFVFREEDAHKVYAYLDSKFHIVCFKEYSKTAGEK